MDEVYSLHKTSRVDSIAVIQDWVSHLVHHPQQAIISLSGFSWPNRAAAPAITFSFQEEGRGEEQAPP